MKKILAMIIAFAMAATGAVFAAPAAAVYADSDANSDAVRYLCPGSGDDEHDITSMDQCVWKHDHLLGGHSLFCKEHDTYIINMSEQDILQHDPPNFGGFKLPSWMEPCTLDNCAEYREAARSGKYVCFESYRMSDFHLVEPEDCWWDEFRYDDQLMHVFLCKEHDFYTMKFNDDADSFIGAYHAPNEFADCCTLFRAQPIDTAKLTMKTYLVYNGKAQTPVSRVTLKGVILYEKEGDYELQYSNNKNVGTATVKLTGKVKYEGYVINKVTINPKGTAIKSVASKKKGFTVKYAKSTADNATGYQVRYSTKSSMAGAKTVKVKGINTASKKVTKLKAKTKYYVQVRTYKTVSGKTYYSAWSAKKSVKTK